MTMLTRRAVLAGATVATALTSLASAQAAAPLAGKQTAGWYRYKVGNHEVTVVTDGQNTFPLPDTFVTNMKKDDVNVALATAYMEKDKMTIPYSPVVVNTGSKLVAIDTGTGEANFERSKGVGGQYHANLKAAGIDRNAVDIVLISHFHGDHINGLLTPDNKPAFANAEILVPAPEEVFHGRRRNEPADHRAHEGRVLKCPPGVRRARPQGHALRVRQGSGARHHVGRDPWPYPGHMSHIVASGTGKVRAGRRHQSSGAVRAQSGLARVLRPGRQDGREPAARSTTCWSPRSCWCKASTIRSRRLPHVEKSGSGYREMRCPGTRCSERPDRLRWKATRVAFFARRRPRDALISISTASPHSRGPTKGGNKGGTHD